MKELFFQKRQNIGLMSEKFIWREARRNCVTCGDKPVVTETGRCGPRHRCVTKEQNEAANEAGRNLSALSNIVEVKANKHATVCISAESAKYGLGSIVLGLKKQLGMKGCLNYSMPVYYRSDKLTEQARKNWMAKKGDCFPVPNRLPVQNRPGEKFGQSNTTVGEKESWFKMAYVNMIYPGQSVSLVMNNGRPFVVVDDCDTFNPPVTPGGGGKRKKKEKPEYDKECDLKELIFGVGTMDERNAATKDALTRMGISLEISEAAFDKLYGPKGIYTITQKVMEPLLSGGIPAQLGSLGAKMAGVQKKFERALEKAGHDPSIAGKILASTKQNLGENAEAYKNMSALVEKQNPANANMLKRDLATYFIGTAVAVGVASVTAGALAIPGAALTAAIVLTNVRLPWIKKLRSMPGVNTMMKSLSPEMAALWTKYGAEYQDMKQDDYTGMVKQSIEEQKNAVGHVRNFMKFEQAILGGLDAYYKCDGKKIDFSADYTKKHTQLEERQDQLSKELVKFGGYIENREIVGWDKGKVLKKAMQFGILDRDGREARQLLKIFKTKEKRNGTVKENTESGRLKVDAMEKFIEVSIREFNEQNKNKKNGRTLDYDEDTGNIIIQENGVPVPEFTTGRPKNLKVANGKLSGLLEFNRMRKILKEYTANYVTLVDYENTMKQKSGESINYNNYQNAIKGFVAEFGSYSEMRGSHKSIAELMDKFGVQKQWMDEYFQAGEDIRFSAKERANLKEQALNNLMKHPEFRNFLFCLGLIAKECEKLSFKDFQDGLRKGSHEYAFSIQLDEHATNAEHRRIAITWGMVEALWRQPWRRTTSSEPELVPNRAKGDMVYDPTTMTFVEGPSTTVWTVNGANGQLALPGTFASQAEAEAAARTAGLFQSSTVTGWGTQESVRIGSELTGISAGGMIGGSIVDNAIGNRQDKTKRKKK